MCSGPMVSSRLQHLLTTTADAAAQASGCVQRTRNFSGAPLCQTLVFGWLSHSTATLDHLCQMVLKRSVRGKESRVWEAVRNEARSQLYPVGPRSRCPEPCGTAFMLSGTR